MDGDPAATPGLRHAWRSGPDRRYLLISLVLTGAGGFADAGSYVRIHSFTGHITGNAILAAVYLVDANWADMAACLVATAAFLAGTAWGARWRHVPDRSAYRRLAGPIVAEIALVVAGLAYAMLALPGGRTPFLACLCLALGLQNGVLGKVESVSFHTTFITGLSTTLIGALVSGKTDPKRQVLPLILGCFLGGAVCGALLVTRFGDVGFGAILVLFGPAWVLAVSEIR